MLTGIGFTMSLFIGTLAFENIEHATAVRLGVLSGSLLSALSGYLLLRVVGTAEPEAEALAEAEPTLEVEPTLERVEPAAPAVGVAEVGGERPPKSESGAPAGTRRAPPPNS